MSMQLLLGKCLTLLVPGASLCDGVVEQPRCNGDLP
jgi:hypothetical protein